MNVFEEYSDVLEVVLERLPFTYTVSTVYRVLDKLTPEQKQQLVARVKQYFSRRKLHPKTLQLYVRDLYRLVYNRTFYYKMQNFRTISKYTYKALSELFPELVSSAQFTSHGLEDLTSIDTRARYFQELLAGINKLESGIDEQTLREIDEFIAKATHKLSVIEQEVRRLFDVLEAIKRGKEYAQELAELRRQQKS